MARIEMLSQGTIEELRQIIGEEYGREVSQAEASEIARTMVGYYDLLAKIHHREQTEDNNDNNNDEFRSIGE